MMVRKRKSLAKPTDPDRPDVKTVAAWMESLTMTQGRRAGERFQLFPWEREFLGQALQPRGGADVSAVHAASRDDDPFNRETWLKANPSLEYLPDLEAAIQDEAARARKDPGSLASFRALRLNMRVSDVLEAELVDADVRRRQTRTGGVRGCWAWIWATVRQCRRWRDSGSSPGAWRLGRRFPRSLPLWSVGG